MEYTGTDITADVSLVWETVIKSFPTMAEAYLAANHAVHWTSAVNGMDVPFMTNWEGLRDQVEYIFADAANNLHDTAVAILESLDELTTRDDETREAVNAAAADLPGTIPELGETTIPLSGRYYGGDYASPTPPDFDYDGDAPTIEALKEKAATVEDRLWQAAVAEMPWFDGLVMGWYDREDLMDTADGDAVREASGGIVSKVEECTKYDPADFEPAVAALESIGGNGIRLFNSFGTEIDNAKDGLHPDNWDSAAADTFRSNFLNAYPDIAETHVMLVGTLSGAMDGYRTAVEDTHRTLDQIMDAAILSCDSIIGGQSAKAEAMATNVLSAAIAVAGTVYTGGGSTAIGFALGGSGVSVASSAFLGGGSTVDEVKANVLDSMQIAHDALDALGVELRDTLGEDYTTVLNGRHKPELRIDLPRPAFTIMGAEGF
ncbi:hypothetical protein LX16_4443 [Stackebrandtia albiflava]|uniref:Uncharacterized protein n=1 Tax=Stackebrandtia albiflava TaxID=406432 RepID=A0A562URH5_9ACTN|nr:hypothetical protein [Stackebrandtia albiflava]TWJ08220.1 hypothetical protein LX16_4443 [Stackebrandtia albiflava]